ncbi:MAG: hypothetical protein RIB46_16635 [Pseudomonadales bacterium]
MTTRTIVLLGAGVLATGVALSAPVRANADDQALAFITGAAVGYVIADRGSDVRPVHYRGHHPRHYYAPPKHHWKHYRKHDKYWRHHAYGHHRYDRGYPHHRGYRDDGYHRRGYHGDRRYDRWDDRRDRRHDRRRWDD